MSRRKGALTAMFDHIARSAVEFNKGRIRWMNTGYFFAAEGDFYVNAGGHKIKGLIDADGKYCILSGKPSTNSCEHPTMWLGRFPRFLRQEIYYHFVPKSLCRKCVHYKPKATRGRPFAACAFLYEKRKGSPGPAETIFKIIGEGMQKANSILNQK